MNTLSKTILDEPITGVRLRGKTLGEEIRKGDNATLLVFLRHYGCIFCKETVRDLKSAQMADPKFPSVLFFGHGDQEETRSFAASIWPEMSIASDPQKVFFNAMGLGKGSVYQMFGPRVWACGLRATLKGNIQLKTVGDVWTMPGLFAVDRDGAVLWTHDFDHIGNHPNWKLLPQLLSQNQGEPSLRANPST